MDNDLTPRQEAEKVRRHLNLAAVVLFMIAAILAVFAAIFQLPGIGIVSGVIGVMAAFTAISKPMRR